MTETPDPVDLTYLSDRARAYVMGLEARVRELREQNDELRAKLAGEVRPDERELRRAREEGWRACADNLASATRGVMEAVQPLYSRAYQAMWEEAPSDDPR